MVCEEEIRDFFFNMSRELEREGYEILNNLHTIFGNYKNYEELLLEEIQNEQELEEELSSDEPI
jgi:muconolactone delta-isomerase